MKTAAATNGMILASRMDAEYAIFSKSPRAMMLTKGRILYKIDYLVPKGGKYDLKYLGDYNLAHCKAAGKPENGGGLILAAVDGLDTAAENFAEIGRIIEHKREKRRFKPPDMDARQIEAEIHK